MPPVPAHWQNAPVSGRAGGAVASGRGNSHQNATTANADERLIAHFMGNGNGARSAASASPRTFQSAFSALPEPLQSYNGVGALQHGQQQQQQQQQLWHGLGPKQPGAPSAESAPLLSQLHQMGANTAETKQRVAQWAAPAASGAMRSK
jgi:hypothetical protein